MAASRLTSVAVAAVSSVRVSVYEAEAVDEDGHRVVPSEDTNLADGDNGDR